MALQDQKQVAPILQDLRDKTIFWHGRVFPSACVLLKFLGPKLLLESRHLVSRGVAESPVPHLLVTGHIIKDNAPVNAGLEDWYLALKAHVQILTRSQELCNVDDVLQDSNVGAQTKLNWSVTLWSSSKHRQLTLCHDGDCRGVSAIVRA